jgi:hypothetical protein
MAEAADVNIKLTVMGDVTLDVEPEGSTLEILANPSEDGTYKAGGIAYKNSSYNGIRLRANRLMSGDALTVIGKNDDSTEGKFRFLNSTTGYTGDQYIPYQLKYGENLVSTNNAANGFTINAIANSNIDFSLDFGTAETSLGNLNVDEEYRDTLTFTFTPPSEG